MKRLPLYLIGFVVAFLATPAVAEMMIPTDMARTCVVDSTDFKSWFSNGKPTVNGPVKPASSVSFTSDHPNKSKGKVEGPNICNFYQWGAQMFLWLTSPVKRRSRNLFGKKQKRILTLKASARTWKN